MLNHHWPQQIVVELLRDARRYLAHFHWQILRENPKDLFDPEKIAKEREHIPFVRALGHELPVEKFDGRVDPRGRSAAKP